MTERIWKPLIVAALILLPASLTLAYGQEAGSGELRLVQGDSPSGSIAFLRPVPAGRMEPHPAWMLRTGIKKGIRDLSLDEEIFAAPDIAILKTGFYEQWADFLIAMKEPFTLAGPGSIAGLAKTKPVLIIPSGGLAGASGSEFFKAGLAEYVRSGGTLVCFAQRSGADYSSLPVPAGARLEAAGWSQDPGPVFGASFIRERHPMLSRMTRAAPRLETSGYLSSAPEGARTVLSRSDGFPTLIVYPFGSGRVVATTLFSEVLSGQGHLDPEERALVQDLLLWAKAPEQVVPAAPGDRLNATVVVRGAEQEDANTVRISVMGPESSAPVTEQVIPSAVKASQAVSLPFTYTVPAGIRPGIYHLEYALLGQRGKAISARIECAEGKFGIGQSPLGGPLSNAAKPLSGAPLRFHVRPAVKRTGNTFQVDLDVLAGAPSAAGSYEEILVRVAGKEKTVTLAQPKTSLSFELSGKEAGRAVPVAFYHSSGRLLLRDAVSLDVPEKQGVLPDRWSYLPGETARIQARELGTGELTLRGLGRVDSEIVPGSGSMAFPVPDNLPAGTYPLAWEFRTAARSVNQGLVTLNVSGYQVIPQDVSVTTAADRGVYTVNAVIALQSGRSAAGRIKLVLSPPDGAAVPVAETAVTLMPGRQEVPVRFTFKPEQAGIWELSSVISVNLPEGPGFPAEPLPVASASALLDVGSAAILGITTDKPVYYDPSGPLEVTTYLYGKGKAKALLSLDGKKAAKERVELAGGYAWASSIPAVTSGVHTLRAELAGEDLVSSRETTVIYGTRLPDLTASIVTSDIKGVVMDVGIGVKNEGKAASAKCRAALYDGDPDQDGAVIGKVDVPPLEPGQLHVSILPWPIQKRTGSRLLVAIADSGNAVAETNKKNNRSSFPIFVPDFFLAMSTQKKELGVNEPLAFSLALANLTSSARKDLVLDVQLLGPEGKTVSSESFPVPELPAAKEKTFQRQITAPAASPVGTYLLTARLYAGDVILANTLSEMRIPPVLALEGSLAGTPVAAVLCGPLNVHYEVTSTGNVAVSAGSLKIEILAPGASKPVESRQLPFSLGRKTFTIDRVDIPAGRYTMVLKASAANQEHGIKKEFILAEQPLTVSGPVAVEPAAAAFPRALIWMGSAGGSTARAVAESMVRQAFEQEAVYTRIVTAPDDFVNQAASGTFNTFVLLDVNDPLEAPRWLKDLTGHGQGMVIIGADDTAKAAAGVFGFTFEEPLAKTGATLSLADNAGMGLSGKVPASGTVLLAKKRGATPLAFKADTGEPAAFLDTGGNGRVVLLPFSLIRSAHDSGASTIYGLVLRAVVHAVAPAREEPGGPSARSFVLSSPSGPVKTKVTVTLPPRSPLIWTNRESTVRENVVTYDMTLDAGPQRLLYLYRPPEGGQDTAVTEVFYECDGKYVSQGKIE